MREKDNKKFFKKIFKKKLVKNKMRKIRDFYR